MNPYVIIGLGVAWLISAGGAFWFGGSYERGQQAERSVLLDKATERFTAANQKLSDDLGLTIATKFAGIKITNTTINQEVRHEREVQTRVLDNPDCNLPSSTIRVLNNARNDRADRPSAGGPAGGLRGDGSAQGTAEPR